MIPIGGGFLSAVLIVVGTPHVTWYLRLLLALIAFVYIGGQSASYPVAQPFRPGLSRRVTSTI
jgi:hypothetical protein